MTRDADGQLKWVQANRTRAPSWTAIGEIAQAALTGPALKGPAWRRALIPVLETHAGSELLSRIEGIDVRGGVLRLEVAEPAVRYELRLRWELRLLALLRAHLPAAGITAVRFVASATS